jgi:DNA/RNA endonuclease YhcR with UshA esterase domain
MEEDNDSQGGILVGYVPNIHIMISIRGKVVEKDYIKEIKYFVFRIQTDKEFTITENNTTINQMIFQFVISKKLHRKYRRIICNGNYIEIVGVLRQHDVFFGKTEVSDRFVIETHAARIYSEENKSISEVPQFPQVGNNETLSIPQLT